MAQRQFRSDDTDLWIEKFGNGSDGDLVVSSHTTFAAANAGCSGNGGSTSLTIDGASSFANGQLVLIHQTAGTGVGGWELNKIASGGGSTSLTMAYNLINTYTDSGASQAQILQLKQYLTATINSGIIYSAPAWNGNIGGLMGFFCTGLVSNAGIINASGLGFRGNNNESYQGEGYSGAASNSRSANGNGGGGGSRDPTNGVWHAGASGGGGGGILVAGETGYWSGGANTGQWGTGGAKFGTGSLTSFTLGGAGGGGGADGGVAGDGGNGAGGIIIIAKSITVTGSIVADGYMGTRNGEAQGGSGGSGGAGAILLKGQVLSLGSSICTAIGAARVDENYGYRTGSAGGAGAIHVDYSQSVSGTTSPSLDSTQSDIYNDPPRESGYSFFM
jgi:hypothetical protein